MTDSHVVTCFLEEGGSVLLVRRSGRVGTYQARWAGISGYVEPGASPLEQARQEILEETGLEGGQAVLLREGAVLEILDEGLGKRWFVHPFRFRIQDRSKVRLDWEHTDFRWIDPGEIGSFETVPGLEAAWDQVAPDLGERMLEEIAGDRLRGASELALRALALLKEFVEADGGSPRLKELAAQMAASRPSMAVLGNVLGNVVGRLEAEGADRGRIRTLLDEEGVRLLTLRERSIREAAERIRGASVLATCSFSSVVVDVLKAASDSGASPEVRILESLSGGIAYGARLKKRLEEAGLSCRQFGDEEEDDALAGADLVLLGADTIFPDGSAVNGWPSRILAEAAASRFPPVPVLVVADSLKLSRAEDAGELEDGFELLPSSLVTELITGNGGRSFGA